MTTNVLCLETEKQKLIYEQFIRYPLEYFSGFNLKSEVTLPEGVKRDQLDLLVSTCGKLAHASTDFDEFNHAISSGNFSFFHSNKAEESLLNNLFSLVNKIGVNNLIHGFLPEAVGISINTYVKPNKVTPKLNIA